MNPQPGPESLLDVAVSLAQWLGAHWLWVYGGGGLLASALIATPALLSRRSPAWRRFTWSRTAEPVAAESNPEAQAQATHESRSTAPLSAQPRAPARQRSSDGRQSATVADPLRHRLPTWVFSGVLLSMLLAAGALVLAGALIAEVAEHLGPDSPVGRMDDAFLAAMASHIGPEARAAFAVASHAGDPWVVTLLAAVVTGVLLLRRQPVLAAAWLLALALNGGITRILKELLQRVRPEHLGDLTVASGYSFPSGHSSASVVAYGWLALLSAMVLPSRWRWPLVAAFAALAWTVGFSRMVLQVHYPSDVLVGMACGMAWLVASALAVHAWGPQTRGWSSGARRESLS